VLQETHAPRIQYDPDLVLRVAVRIIVSAILGCTVTEGLYFIDRLRPYSSIRDRIIDALTLPGILIARLFPLVGVHTGNGSSSLNSGVWWAFFLGNSFFYAALCYFILDVSHIPSERREL